MSRRVVITGIGVVAPGSIGVPAFWSALVAGEPVAAVEEFERVGPAIVSRVSGFDAPERFGKKEARRMDPAAQFAVAAAREALEQAGDLELPAERIGVSIGNVHGGIATLDEAYALIHAGRADRVSPFLVPLSLSNSPAASVARLIGLHGPASSTATACAAGSDAIGQAAEAIQLGRADAMVAGGCEAAIGVAVIAGYRSLGATSKRFDEPLRASRPFDRDRDGFVMGEGAGILVLEAEEHALRRGARILAVLGGYGASCDGGHLTSPDASGEHPARAVRAALAQAGVAASDVGYINAHATSTPVGDASEARVVQLAGLAGTPVNSTKAIHGHTLGAAGGVEAIAALMAIVDGALPATVNLDAPDEESAALCFAVGGPLAAPAKAVVSNSFGFGGHNAVLVFTQP